jgi:hypothetical protein
MVTDPTLPRDRRGAQNIDVSEFMLTGDHMVQVAALDTGVSVAFGHPNPSMIAWLKARSEGWCHIPAGCSTEPGRAALRDEMRARKVANNAG